MDVDKSGTVSLKEFKEFSKIEIPDKNPVRFFRFHNPCHVNFEFLPAHAK